MLINIPVNVPAFSGDLRTLINPKTFSVGQKLQSDNKHTKNNSLFPMMSCEDSGDELCLIILLNRPL